MSGPPGILKQQVGCRRGLHTMACSHLWDRSLSQPPPKPQTRSSPVPSLVFLPLQVPSALQGSSWDI